MSEFRDSRGYDVEEEENQAYRADDGLRLGDYDLDGLDYEDTGYYGIGTSDPGDVDVREEGEVGGELSPAHSTHEPVVSPGSDIDIAPLLCHDHGLNLDDSCDRCEKAKFTIHPQVFESLRVVDESKSSIPDASARFSSMRPAKKPSLVLSPSAMSFAQMVYRSVPLTKSQFEELVRNSVHVSQAQNSELMANLQLEKILMGSGGGMRDVKNMMIKNLKNHRIAQRPLLVLVDTVDQGIRGLKAVGVSAGLEYPAEPPTVQLMGPDLVPDHLGYSGHDDVLPLPNYVDVVDGVELPSQEARTALLKNLELRQEQEVAFQKRAKTLFLNAYDSASKTLLHADNLANVYL